MFFLRLSYLCFLFSLMMATGFTMGQSDSSKAAKGNNLTLPMDTGATKVMFFGKMPIKFNLQYWYYVASTEAFGPQHQIRFTVSPVLALPW